MTAIEILEPTEVVTDSAGISAGRRARRRDEIEMLGLLVGILLVLFVLALTLGAGGAYLA